MLHMYDWMIEMRKSKQCQIKSALVMIIIATSVATKTSYRCFSCTFFDQTHIFTTVLVFHYQVITWFMD